MVALTLRKKTKTPGGGVRKISAEAVKTRRSGRPSAKDENVGPQRLVEAARELLQTVAPAKLTAGQVAKAAGADRALIRYYFGSMPNLLAEVAAQLSRGLVTSLAEASNGNDGALARLSRRIHEFVRYELANPALHPLYAQQILSGKAPGAKKTLESVAAAESCATISTRGSWMSPSSDSANSSSWDARSSIHGRPTAKVPPTSCKDTPTSSSSWSRAA